jgi:hypothetical protein
MDKGMFLTMLAGSMVPDSLLVRFNDAIDGILSPFEKIVDVVNDVSEMLDQLDPLGAIADAVSEAVGDVLDWFDFSVSQSIGGAGNDILASGGNGGDMVGGQGDDTYLFTFGFGGAHVIDEAGFATARDWSDLLGIDDALLDKTTGGGGGSDVIEIRGLMGLVEVGIDNLSFEQSNAGDLSIGLQTEGGLQVGLGTVTLTDMDDLDNRVETLRLVNASEVIDIDIGRAFDDGLFDLGNAVGKWWSDTVEGVGQILDGEVPMAWTKDAGAALRPYVTATSATSTTQTAFEGRLDGWIDSFELIAGTAETAGTNVARAVEAVRDWDETLVPETPDIFQFA